VSIKTGRERVVKLEPLRTCEWLDGAHCFFDERQGVHRRDDDPFAPCLDSRVRENFFDNRQQVRADGLDPAELGLLRFVHGSEDPIREQFGVSGHRADRRAQLVAHRRKEFSFRAIRELSLLHRCTQLILTDDALGDIRDQNDGTRR
jgi:hypothetical protein